MQSSLTWQSTINNLILKLNSKCYLIRSLKFILNTNSLIKVYYAEVESRLRYGILLWGTSPLMERVLVAQKRIVRSLAGVMYRESCRPHFKQLKILTAVNVYILEAVINVYKIKDTLENSCSAYNTRNNTIKAPKHRLSITADGPIVMGIKLLNHLPAELKLKPIKSFRRNLKLILLENPFYSLDEYLRTSL